jgi:serine/threonine protein kinase
MVHARDFAGNQRFEVLTRLGRGGMGTVYQVIDHTRKSRVALKAVGQVRGDALLRFKREFRALSEITHQHIIELGELFEQDGEWFFTMELIAGTDFLSYVRPNGGRRSVDLDAEALAAQLEDAPLRPGSRLGGHPVAVDAEGFDEGRLRRSLGQLAEALHVLHMHGQVHRDIKPSNVLVTQDGRVVVIDFGLVTGGLSHGLSTEAHVLGTVAYMPPEQAAHQHVGPEADWYAFGAMIYEALTGRLPIEAPNMLVLMMRKQAEVPVRPRELVAGVPEDLDALCMELLRIDPTQRPKARAVLERLHVDAARVKRVSSAISIAERSEEFVARESELRLLEAELGCMFAGEQRIVTIVGESGLGKSALLRRFAQHVESEHAQALVLHGRCYEHETLPYKALDAVMDQLSRWLKRQPRERVEKLLPEDVALLERVFPVLHRVPAIAKAGRGRAEVKDPTERRLLVMRALRALFDTLSREVPLVLLIDDFQWSDRDSAGMLAQLTGPPSPPPFMLVFATRQEEDALPLQRQGGRLKLGPLSHAESVELAVSMARHTGQVSLEVAEAVARQSEGFPFLIESLLHQTGEASAEGPQLDEGIEASMRGLPTQARRLMQVVCLAGYPITQQVAAEASGLEPAEFIQHLRALRLSRMVRTSGPLNTDLVEPYHNRIRESVVLSVPEDEGELMHHALAYALETHHGEPQRIAYHLSLGGEPRRATGYVIAAAERAFEALAFDRAAALYAEVQRGAELPDVERRRLGVARGHALACAGRGKEAAQAFAEVIPGSSSSEMLDLRRRIAEQLLNAGYYEEGTDACEKFAQGLGIRAPKSPLQVFWDLVRSDLWLRIRGLGSRIRERDQLSSHEMLRVDAYWAMAKGLASYDPVRAQALHSRGLLAALKAGEPYRLSRAIALFALKTIIGSPAARERATTMLVTARSLAERSRHPHALAFVSFLHMMIEYLGHCRFQRALERLEPVEKSLRAHCEDVAWEVDQCNTMRLQCQYWLGSWGQLVVGASDLCKEAEARGNRYTLVMARSEFMSLALAFQGEFARAHREIDEVIDPAHKMTSPVEIIIYHHAHLRVDLYEGAVARALQRVDGYRPRLIERLTLGTTFIRLMYESVVLNVLLAAAATEQGRAAQRLFARAQRSAKGLVRKGVECSVPLAMLAHAAVQAARSDVEGAVRLLVDAEAGFEREGMLAHRAAARLRRGQLVGGEPGRALVQEGEQFFVSQGARDVAAALRLLAPGFPADR